MEQVALCSWPGTRVRHDGSPKDSIAIRQSLGFVLNTQALYRERLGKVTERAHERAAETVSLPLR